MSTLGIVFRKEVRESLRDRRALRRFAMADSRHAARLVMLVSTAVFINYVENNRLAARNYNFTAFGKVVEGMDVVDKFAEVGEPGMGLDQDRLWNDGDAYLKELTAKPTMILSVQTVKQ